MAFNKIKPVCQVSFVDAHKMVLNLCTLYFYHFHVEFVATERSSALL